MQSTEPIQRVRIYLSERDTIEGQSLHSVLLDRLRQAGATGATVLRGVAGFGPSHRLRIEREDSNRSAPIIVEWVDRAERVARLLPTLDELLPNAMITIEDVHVYRATLRASGPFGERLVGAVTARDVVVAHANTSLIDALQQLVERPQSMLPILDNNRRIVGTVATDAIAAATRLPMRLLAALTEEERAIIFAQMPKQTLTEHADSEPRTLAADAPIPQAVSAMVEWGLEALPVVDRNAQFVGLLGVEQMLRSALEGRSADGPVRDAEPAPPVRLLMQGAVPTIAAATPAVEALTRLLAAPERFLVVMDERQPIGILDDAHILRQLTDGAREKWLTALRDSSSASIADELPFLADTAGTLPLAPAPTVRALATRDDATHTLLDSGLERLLVVEDTGALVGLIGRRGLLRALAQELTS